MLLEIDQLQVTAEGKDILRGVCLQLEAGQTMALMGPNGSGKSTLAHVLMGHPGYAVVSGTVRYKGQDLLAMKPEERAQAGLFLSFQYPQSIAGVTIANFLRLAYTSRTGQKISVKEFVVLLKQRMDLLGIPHLFMTRPVNEGFSGGEKKKLEMLQLALLGPDLAILDETDSGLDVDALKAVAKAVQAVAAERPTMALLIITHYHRLLDYLPVQAVAVMRQGVIVSQGDMSLVAAIEEKGYEILP